MSDSHELELILRSRVPVIAIETGDETRFLKLLKQIAIDSPSHEYRPLFRWTVTDGLQRLDLDLEPQRHAIEPKDVLGHIRSVTKPGIYALLDFHPFLTDPMHTRLLKDIAINARTTGTVVVLISHRIEIPDELRSFSARFDAKLPGPDERRKIVMRVVAEFQQAEPGVRVQMDPAALELLIDNLRGLNSNDAERIARAAVVDDSAITHSDLPEVMQAKYRLLNASGVLGFEFDTARFSDIAGFSNLKRWLGQRQATFSAAGMPGLDPPRGILLLGVQGCGKSLAAKAAASTLGVPLLRLDFGTLYNKYHGETERNLREALSTAEVLSPCVLWIDEIEKGLATDSSDTGTSRRVLGSLLTWMAERHSKIFMVATANDIQSLPPELIRKGRFDEIFFVDLPGMEQRASIFDIHLRKRQIEAAGLDLPALAEATNGYSGAEIEQAVVAALYSAHADGTPLNQAHLLTEIGRTRPLSVIMAERVAALRQWASDRTVPAD